MQKPISFRGDISRTRSTVVDTRLVANTWWAHKC